MTPEEKIADIKANCDLAIESRDIKIQELEQKLEQTEKDLADYQFNYPSIKELEEETNKLLDVINNQDVKIADLEKENAELKEKNRKKEYQEENYLNKIDHKEEVINTLQEMIEKMKCCENCKYGYCGWSSESIDKDGNRTFHAWNKEKQKYCDIGKNGKYQCWEIKE